jgi:AbrB family looped-hinge helix DNA binding protein
MREFLSSVSPKGQITIPIEIRRRLGIKPRDRVAMQVEGAVVTLTPAPPADLEASYQAVPALTRRRTLDEIEALAHAEHAQEAAREGLPE